MIKLTGMIGLKGIIAVNQVYLIYI